MTPQTNTIQNTEHGHDTGHGRSAGSGRSRWSALTYPLALMLIVGALLTGCGSSHKSAGSPATSAPGAAAAGGPVIVIKNFAYSPVSLTVKPGATVTVKNEDVAPHTVTASGSGKFDTGNISPGASMTFTAPTAPGTYPYICSIHQFMHGTLVVS
ncbi:MAG TPA: cupredoxin domain-containing protein [Acidimicrobiales bacterium]|nr:cupredoxin domain-containing protein [Acidimicrobiales bacterium]